MDKINIKELALSFGGSREAFVAAAQGDEQFQSLSLVEKAYCVAVFAHRDQSDKAGKPYIEHIEFVGLGDNSFPDAAKAVGLLHDLLEDTDFTANDLEQLGFPKDVIHSIRLMKHEKGVQYFDYVMAGSSDKNFRLVKARDNLHNSDRSRFPADKKPSEKLLEKWEFVYPLCCAFLMDIQAEKFPVGTHITDYIVNNKDLSPALRDGARLAKFVTPRQSGGAAYQA